MRTLYLCCALLIASSASAQSFGFGVQGNLSNLQLSASVKDLAGVKSTPTNTALEQVYGLGVGGGAHLDLNLSILTLRLSADYMSLSPDNAKFKTWLQSYLGPSFSNVSIDGGRITEMSVQLNAKLVILPLPVFHPYVTAGGGFASVKMDDATISINGIKVAQQALIKSQTVSTLNGGVGVDLAFGGFAIYGEVKVNVFYLSEGNGTYLPIATVGVTF
ncbi:MAG: outer membrane beta-barrel protein [Bacteroidota bacterium]